MTNISRKPNSPHTNNGQVTAPQNLQLQDGTSGIHTLPSYNSEATELSFLIPKAPVPQQRQGRWNWASLRTRATVLAVTLGTVPVLITGLTAYFFANQSISEQITTTKIQRATGLEDKMKRFMRERYADIQTLVRRNFLATTGFRDKLTVADKEDQLNAIVETYKVYDLISIQDLQGNVILKSKSDPLPNQADREYFQEVLKTDKPVISDALIPRVSTNPERPAINIAAPVKDSATGQTIAVARIRLPVESLADVSANFGTQGDEFYVLDNSLGKVFLGSDKKKEFKDTQSLFPGLSKLEASDKPSTTVFSDVDRKEKVFAFTKFGQLEGLPTLDWRVVIATPTDIAFGPQRQLLVLVLIGTLIAAVVVTAIAIYLTNQAVRPILDAAGAVDKIGQGQLGTRLKVLGEDEIAQLGANINGMAEQLEEFVQEQTLAAERARLLAKVTGSRALSSQQLNELFSEILTDARKTLKVDRVVFLRFNTDGTGEVITESLGRGWQSAFNIKFDISFISEQLLEAYNDGRIEPIGNLLERESTLNPERVKILERLDVKATIEVPILNEGQPYGLLMAHHCEAPHNWQSSEIDFLKQLAGQIGLSLDRVVLLEQTELLAEEQRQQKEGLQKRALELLQEVDPISKGDLTIRAKVTADEIGTIADSYNATVGNLRKIVLQVQGAVTQVAETTSTNEASIQALSAEALRQAEEISAALERAEQMAQSVQLVAANAEQALAAVQEASETVEEGDAAMNRTVDGILAIRETVAETAKKVKHLGESSQKISTVVKLISTFAAQTNQLAHNASL